MGIITILIIISPSLNSRQSPYRRGREQRVRFGQLAPVIPLADGAAFGV